MSHNSHPDKNSTNTILTRPAPISRRSFLKRSSIAAAGALLIPSTNAIASMLSRERTLNFLNVNTN